MQTLVEMFIAAVVFLASAALSQFGVDTQDTRREREVHRTDCQERAPQSLISISDREDC